MTTDILKISHSIPLSLAGPLLCMVSHLYPDAQMGDEPGTVMILTSESGTVDMKALEDLMDWLEEYKR